MKKSRFLPIMIGLTFVTLILSCNNDNTSKTTDEEAVSIEQLFTNIDEYNTLFCKENNVDMTRATREQRRYKRQIVAQADAGGVISGLIVGGAVGVGSLPLAIIGGVYTVGLRQVIENAAISDKSKTVIRAGISTAFGSENLWFN